MWGVGSNSLQLPVPESTPEGLKLLLKQCWSWKPRNRPSFRHILMHLDIASAEMQDLTEERWYAMQEEWKTEVGVRMETMRGGSQHQNRFSKEEELIRRRREELRHANEVREHYEHKLRRANNLYDELNCCMQQLEQRERQILRREKQLYDLITNLGLQPLRKSSRPRHRMMRQVTVRAGPSYLKGVPVPPAASQGVQCGWPVSVRGPSSDHQPLDVHSSFSNQAVLCLEPDTTSDEEDDRSLTVQKSTSLSERLAPSAASPNLNLDPRIRGSGGGRKSSSPCTGSRKSSAPTAPSFSRQSSARSSGIASGRRLSTASGQERFSRDSSARGSAASSKSDHSAVTSSSLQPQYLLRAGLGRISGGSAKSADSGIGMSAGGGGFVTQTSEEVGTHEESGPEEKYGSVPIPIPVLMDKRMGRVVSCGTLIDGQYGDSTDTLSRNSPGRWSDGKAAPLGDLEDSGSPKQIRRSSVSVSSMFSRDSTGRSGGGRVRRVKRVTGTAGSRSRLGSAQYYSPQRDPESLRRVEEWRNTLDPAGLIMEERNNNNPSSTILTACTQEVCLGCHGDCTDPHCETRLRKLSALALQSNDNWRAENDLISVMSGGRVATLEDSNFNKVPVMKNSPSYEEALKSAGIRIRKSPTIITTVGIAAAGARDFYSDLEVDRQQPPTHLKRAGYATSKAGEGSGESWPSPSTSSNEEDSDNESRNKQPASVSTCLITQQSASPKQSHASIHSSTATGNTSCTVGGGPLVPPLVVCSSPGQQQRVTFRYPTTNHSTTSEDDEQEEDIQKALKNFQETFLLIQDITCLRFQELDKGNTSANIRLKPSFAKKDEEKHCSASGVRPPVISGTVFVYGKGKCLGRSVAYHETGHVFGMIHTQERWDRDDYVEVFLKNIPSQWHSEYEHYAYGRNLPYDRIIPYDYGSIMHYSSSYYGKGKKTLDAKEELYQQTMGSGREPSFLDTYAWNKVYKCDCVPAMRNNSVVGLTGLLLKKMCVNGGYPDPNNCGRCKCPSGFGGHICQDPEAMKNPNFTLCQSAVIQVPDSLEWQLFERNWTGNDFMMTCAWHFKGVFGAKVEIRNITGWFSMLEIKTGRNITLKDQKKPDWRLTGYQFRHGSLPDSLKAGEAIKSISNRLIVIWKSDAVWNKIRIEYRTSASLSDKYSYSVANNLSLLMFAVIFSLLLV